MSKKQNVAKSAAMIAIFTLLSKALGFIREVMIASRYGSGIETDTYFVAMTATVIIVGTLGAALNTTLIPIFSEIGGKRGTNGQLKYLNNITGNGALAIAIVVYGNRHYDDALLELRDILELNGFKVIAGGAFIGEHSFSKTLSKDRPDKQDIVIVNDFANQIYKKIANQDNLKSVVVSGNRPYRKYYIPKNEKGELTDIRKVAPKTNSNCIDCKICVAVCPMGSIDYEDVSKLNGICIKCCACIKKCPTHAKYYDDKDYLRHKHELEVECVDRREPLLFI